jgi:hypothetical protein
LPPDVVVCGSDLECGSGSFCAFPDHKCGTGTPKGECEFLSTKEKCAGQLSEDVCGCNGQVFVSRCAAQTIGDTGQNCTAPAQTFQCGYLFCKVGMQFCSEKTKGTASEFSCVDWTCSTPGCKGCSDINASCTCEVRQDKNVIEHCGT